MRATPQAVLGAVLRRRSAEHSSRLAYTFLVDGESAGPSLTYGELDTRARAIAASLQPIGSPSDRVLLLFPTGIEFVAALFACFYARRIAVPIAAGKRHVSLVRGIADDCRPAVVLTTQAMMSKVRAAYATAPEVATLPWTVVDEIQDDAAACWSDDDLDHSEASELALLQYTSGSTAAPKGVMVTHDNIRQNAQLGIHCLGADEHAVYLAWSPLFHDFGLVGGIFQPFFANAPAYLMSPGHFVQQPRRWLAAIGRFGVTVSGGPNFAYDLCVDRIPVSARAELDLRSWRVAANGAEVVRASTIERFSAAFSPHGFARRAFRPGYGLAESTLMVTCPAVAGESPPFSAEPEALRQRRAVPATSPTRAVSLVSSGRALPGHLVAIVDPDSHRRCDAGHIGEIWVHGPSVTRGYWGAGEQDDDRFCGRMAGDDQHRFLRTGDLGFLREDELFVAGRLKDLIVVDGRNVHPEAIEVAVEQAHPEVESNGCAAFSVEADDRERLVLAVETRQRVDTNAYDRLARAIRRTVADLIEVDVSTVVFTAARQLPRTTSGKLRRATCRQAFVEGTLPARHAWAAAADMAPSGGGTVEATAPAVEAWLVGRLAAALDVPQTTIDTRQPLDTFGLSSRAALELAGELSDRLGRPLSPTILVDADSIQDIVSTIVGTEPAQAGAQTDELSSDITPDDARALLARLGDLSPSEVDELLRLHRRVES